MQNVTYYYSNLHFCVVILTFSAEINHHMVSGCNSTAGSILWWTRGIHTGEGGCRRRGCLSRSSIVELAIGQQVPSVVRQPFSVFLLNGCTTRPGFSTTSAGFCRLNLRGGFVSSYNLLKPVDFLKFADSMWLLFCRGFFFFYLNICKY